MHNHKLTNFLSIIILLSLLSCAKDKTHLPARLYHNTTSYFNGYYNAKLLFKETLRQIEENYEFPMSGFIEVINYGTEDEIKSYTGQFDEIIKKNDIVIFKHPNGNYVDKCRLLNGKAQFYKKEYSLAMQNFDEVLDKFPDSDLLPEVHFWRAQTFYMMENREMSRSILEEQILYNDTIDLSKKLRAELAIFRSRMALEEKNYEEAVKLLEEEIENIGNNLRRAKAHFLLGQLYDELDNFPKSLEHFSEVSKHINDYEFVFRAKMKVARLYVEHQTGKDDDMLVYEYLNKLLKDEKNEEYRDQIYYEFALLELKKDSLNRALDYLRNSLDVSAGNQRQKALSYYKSGQIYFYQMQDYPSAQAYFDSAASVVTPEAPEYKEIVSLAKTLKEYVTALETIHYQDSMLWLASLPEQEVNAIVDSIVAREARLKREEEERRLAELQKQQQGNFTNPALLNQATRRNNGRNQQGGQWYFDNPAAVTNGRLQFQQLWGQRPNEDNWRRSKKGPQASFASAEEDSASAETVVDSTALKQYGDKYKYYKDIPKTEEEKALANEKIEEAMYKLGQIYAQNLNEPDSAIKTYEALLDRYENSEYTLRARYALYKLYTQKGSPLAEAQKNVILNEYPNTIYAYLILGKDPNELRKEEEEYLYAYDGLFAAYYNKEYETSLGFSEFLLQEYGDNENLDQAKLHYIRGMSYGYMGEMDSLRKILTYVITQFPESEVVPKAKETLALMDNGFSEVRPSPFANDPQGEEVDVSGSLADPNNPRYEGFSAEVKPNDKVFVLMYLDKNAITKAEAQTKIGNFNQQHAKDLKLKVFIFLYKQTHLVPYINRFPDIAAAQQYIEQFKASDIGQEVLSSDGAEVFYITHSNFKVAYGKKRMTDYIEYYKNILNK